MDSLILSMLLYLKGLGIETISPQVDKPRYEIVSTDEMYAISGSNARGLCVDGKIYINKNQDLNSCIGRSIILHELVHYAQNYCPKQPDRLKYEWNERLAYAAQNSYLRDQGCKERVMFPNTNYTEYYEDVM